MNRFQDVIGHKAVVLALAAICQKVRDNPSMEIPPVILHGTHGIGKTTLAGLYAKGLTCPKATNGPCGECSSCTSSTHPTRDYVYGPSWTTEDAEHWALWTESKFPFPHVLVVEDVDRLTDEQTYWLSHLLDTRAPRVAVVMTCHDVPPDALLTHAIPLDLHPLADAEASSVAFSYVTRDEPMPSSLVWAAHGIPRALRLVAERWNLSPVVDERQDMSPLVLRGILTTNLEGGLTAIHDHVALGGTTDELLSNLVALVTELMYLRTAKGVVLDEEQQALSDRMPDAVALAILRVLYARANLTYIPDPNVRLRAIYALLCAAAHPDKFTVKPLTPTETVSVEEASPVPHVEDIEAIGAEFFGSE